VRAVQPIVVGIVALLVLIVSLMTLSGREDTPLTPPFGSPSPSPAPIAAATPSPTAAPFSPALPTPDAGAQQDTAPPTQTTPAPTVAATPLPTAAPTPASAATPAPIAAGPVDDDRGTTPVTGGGSKMGVLWLAGAAILRRLLRR
jgi:hypothetical protein